MRVRQIRQARRGSCLWLDFDRVVEWLGTALTLTDIIGSVLCPGHFVMEYALLRPLWEIVSVPVPLLLGNVAV